MSLHDILIHQLFLFSFFFLINKFHNNGAVLIHKQNFSELTMNREPKAKLKAITYNTLNQKIQKDTKGNTATRRKHLYELQTNCPTWTMCGKICPFQFLFILQYQRIIETALSDPNCTPNAHLCSIIWIAFRWDWVKLCRARRHNTLHMFKLHDTYTTY